MFPVQFANPDLYPTEILWSPVVVSLPASSPIKTLPNEAGDCKYWPAQLPATKLLLTWAQSVPVNPIPLP